MPIFKQANTNNMCKRLFFWSLFLQFYTLFTQEIPPICNFSPKEYRAENQNWSIAQNQEKWIYIANNKGLLAYNGANWMLYPSPNETTIRSVKVVDDLIFTGCYEEFGYWVKNEFGTLDYTSLSKQIKHKLLEDEAFWSIEYLENKVLFQSKKRIYIYDLIKKTFSFFSSETSLPRLFNTQQDIYFQITGLGLYQITNGSKTLVNGDSVFRQNEIINVLANDDDLLIVTQNQGFYKIIDGVLERWNTDADTIMDGKNVYSAIRLKNHDLAIGTVSNGLLLLDANGKLNYQMDVLSGLRNNTILSIYEDIDLNIWLGLDNGISCINSNSPYQVYKDLSGSIGSVYDVLAFEDMLYLGTNQGLYYKPLVDDTIDFRLIAGMQGQVWSLNLLDGELFCGHHSGTFKIVGNKAT